MQFKDRDRSQDSCTSSETRVFMADSLQRPHRSLAHRLKVHSFRFLGYLIAAAALVWAFHSVDPRRLAEDVIHIEWWLAALAILADVLSYVARAVRWRILLKPVIKISLFCSTQAVFAGMLGNQIFPMKVGELIRTYIVSRWMGREFAAIFPSVITERLIDGFWSALLIGCLAILLPLPEKVQMAGDVLGFCLLVAVASFLIAAYWRRKHMSGNPSPGRVGRIGAFLDRLLAGLWQVGSSRWLFEAIGVTLTHLFFQALTFWLILRSYGIDLTFAAGAVVFFIVYVGIVLPTTPGDIGLFQLFCVLGLAIFGVSKTTAAGFSIVVFVLRFLPVAVLGFAALKRSEISLEKIRKDISGRE